MNFFVKEVLIQVKESVWGSKYILCQNLNLSFAVVYYNLSWLCFYDFLIDLVGLESFLFVCHLFVEI